MANGRISRLLVVGLLLAAVPPSFSQFGKNKITYGRFDWQVYHSPHFDIHYYPPMEPFLEDVVSFAESAYLKISKDLDHELRFRVPLITYKTHGEFQETNITLSELPAGVAAFAEPVQNRMVLPIDLPPDKLYELIAHELVHIFQYSMFFEGYLGRALRSDPPTWLFEGMASYLAKDEDNLDRMAIRDAVVNNVLPPIEELNVVTFLTYRYGHAIFDFIEQEHGIEGMRTFLFEYRKVLVANNLNKAVKEAFGYELDEFNRRFNRYLRRRYFPVLLEKKSPDDYGREIGVKRPGVFTFSPTISPSGELVAALASPKLELDLVVLSADDGKLVKNLTKGWTNKYRSLVAAAFEAKRDLSWSPTGDQVAVFAQQENRWPLLIFNALKPKLERVVPVGRIVECATPAYSPDGRRIAFEGNLDGVVDIFEIDLETREIRNLTADEFFDGNPWYAADGKTLLYNRRIGSHWKIFSVDLADATRKTQLTFGTYSDVQPAFSRDGKTIFFSSDRGAYGVFNIHALDLATGGVLQYTDVVGGCFSPVEMAEREGENYLAYTAYFEGTFRLYRMALRQPEVRAAAEDVGAQSSEVVPFEPPLSLTTDESAKHRYKPKWDIEAPSVSVGVADDGTFLSQVGLQFSDLLGDQRVQIIGASVSDFANYRATYFNLRRRIDWGVTAFDLRDYFLSASNSGLDRDQIYRATGAYGFLQYPISRNYRIEGSLGAIDSSQDYFIGYELDGSPAFATVDDRFATVGVELTGDTTRFQRFGPFQGKRFSVGSTYGAHLSGDVGGGLDEAFGDQLEGDFFEHRLDFRFYRQATRRSVLGLRMSALLNTGDRQNTYGFGGINQLRGYEFREFVGSNLVWTNLEFRFPLVDELRFPVLRLVDIRGFFFLDVGAAWLDENAWYDPEQLVIDSGAKLLLAEGGVRFDPATNATIDFDFWDSDGNRLQDGRAAYGAGFQFIFIGGLQFNWVWSKRLDHTSFCTASYTAACVLDVSPSAGPLERRRIGGEGTRTDFYIAFDF